MTYKEYSNHIAIYNKAISSRKSLLMTIRMNKVWLINKNSKQRGLKRIALIKAAQKQLDSLIIPPKPSQPIGYQVTDNNEQVFAGFWATDDIEQVKEEAAESLGHNNFTLKAKPRFRD